MTEVNAKIVPEYDLSCVQPDEVYEDNLGDRWLVASRHDIYVNMYQIFDGSDLKERIHTYDAWHFNGSPVGRRKDEVRFIVKRCPNFDDGFRYSTAGLRAVASLPISTGEPNMNFAKRIIRTYLEGAEKDKK